MQNPFKKKKVYEVYAHRGEDGMCVVYITQCAQSARRYVREVKRIWNRTKHLDNRPYYGGGKAHIESYTSRQYWKEMLSEY